VRVEVHAFLVDVRDRSAYAVEKNSSVAACSAASRPDPAALVLRRADVGHVYAADGSPVGNADAAQGAPCGFRAKLARWGRLSGYLWCGLGFRRRPARASPGGPDPAALH
jgi:hypothetical protein